MVNNAGGAVSGSFTSFNVSDGRVLTQMIGTGPGKSFLQQNLNGGNVEREEFEVFLPGLNRNHKIKFDSNDYYDGVRVSKFYMTPGLTSPSEVTQGNGQNPYPNLVNMIYFTEGIPAILSLANFIGVDEDIYQQSSNAKRGYPDYVGVTLYRTRESYNRDAELIEPSEITILTIREFEDDFISWWEFEPATGLTVTNQIASMFSMFTLNCNPMLDPTCTFAREGTTDLCYRTTVGTEAVSSPCSAANVFTPLVQGEKIYPLYWNRVRASPPEDALKAVTDILGVRYAFSILCIVVPGLFFILVLYTVALWARGNGVFESNHNRDSMIGMTNRKSSAPADRTASVDSEINPMQQ